MLEELLRSLPNRTRPLTILIVDDQPLNVRVQHTVFRDSFEVLMATDGEQAIAICRDQHPDLVLLDVMMPGLDGHDVCRRLKESHATREIPVIFVTALEDAEDEALGFASGAVDFIKKPINPVTLMARVKTHLALKLQGDLLRSIALVDGLTGVANRRQFDAHLSRSWRRCQRERQPLSLLLIDVDQFKRYNDHYGHLAGDECLVKLAQVLSASLRRPDDLIARYGGEEFVCILPNTPYQGALDRANTMLDAMRAAKLEHAASTTGAIVSISAGLATIVPHQDSTPQALLAAADARLYDAKQNGRDQVQGVDLRAS